MTQHIGQSWHPNLDDPFWAGMATPGTRAVWEESAQAHSAVLGFLGEAPIAEDLDHRVASNLAFDKFGCWRFQEILAGQDTRRAIAIALSLRGKVMQAVDSPYANFCIAKIVDTLPLGTYSWIFEEIEGHRVAVARHRYGCRLINALLNRQLMQAENDPIFAEFVGELIRTTTILSRHDFGKHAIKMILEHGSSALHRRVCAELVEDLAKVACHRNGRGVILCALNTMSHDMQEDFVFKLLGSDEFWVFLGLEGKVRTGPIRSRLAEICHAVLPNWTRMKLRDAMDKPDMDVQGAAPP